MSEPTNTRATLRRRIARQLGMPFASRYDSRTLTANGTASSAIDSGLNQADDYWNQSWFYNVDNDEMAKITDFAQSTGTMTLGDTDLDTGTVSGDEYEIHSVWNALDIHRAIDRAIEDSFPSFFEIAEDETIIIQEDTLEYDLTSITNNVWRVLKIFFEVVTEAMTGTADSSTTNTLTDSELIGELGDVDSDWRLAIYAGAAKGEHFAVSSVNDSTGAITINGNWVGTPDTTSKYKLYNAAEEIHPWWQLEAARFNTFEYPSTLYLFQNYPSLVGQRMRIQYIHPPQALATDAATTVVPQEYIIEKAMSILFGIKVNDNRADRQRYASLEEYHRQLAEQYKITKAFETPAGTRWNTHNTGGSPFGAHEDDPLGWYD